MKRLSVVFFCILIGLIPLGLLFRSQYFVGGNWFFILGFLGVFIYFFRKTLKDLINKRFDKIKSTLQVLILLMTFILFSKYLFHSFGDYLGLFIIPIYVFFAVFYLVKEKEKDLKLTISTVLYLLMTIPLFGVYYYESPIQYIPNEWYGRYTVSESIPIDMPFEFKKKEAEELSIKAFQLAKSKQYSDAIPIYRTAINIEPQNPKLYFDLANCYAFTDNLEQAILLLDTAIVLNSEFAPFYSNRGLLHYKLKQNDNAIRDFKYSIKLDSTNSKLYFNLSLVLYEQNQFEESCKAYKNAERLGLNTRDEMKEVIKKKCE